MNSAEDRFWRHVDRSSADGCWIWTGCIGTRGYGLFQVNGRPTGAHRWILGVTRGKPLERGEVTRHTCDNPPCVRPDHLVAGTHSDNMIDSVERGRHRQVRKTHCPQGHEYTPENTRYSKNGARRCQTCFEEHARRYREQHREYYRRLSREWRARQSTR